MSNTLTAMLSGRSSVTRARALPLSVVSRLKGFQPESGLALGILGILAGLLNSLITLLSSEDRMLCFGLLIKDENTDMRQFVPLGRSAFF